MAEEPETNGVDAKQFFPARAGTVCFEVWNMPADRYKEFVALTKEIAGGKMAVAIMTLMELAKTYERYAELGMKIDELQTRIQTLENKNVKEKPKAMTLSEMREQAQKTGDVDGTTGTIPG